MKYIEIILNLPVNMPFIYSYSSDENENSELFPKIGKRAEIMFGNKKTTGFIVNVSNEKPSTCTIDDSKIKEIRKVLDKEPLFGEELISLAKWISYYYLCTFGEAVFSMIPSGRREISANSFSFEDLVPKKITLSEEQASVVKNILNSKEIYHYVYGCTGSGKTEVFLKLAEHVIAQNKSVIYLVPEISLTAQVTKAFIERFGDNVAILHSGLTPSEKLSEWHRIMNQKANIVIGARSAIFAPVINLGLIIIDEEHDNSYKSGTTPRYHGRQVAMYRASKLKIPLVMGSATPSLEAWQLMNEGKIIKHVLTKRLSGGTLPKIECVNLSNFKMEGCISPVLENEINQTIENKHQVILFLNRRGFSHFFRCNSCGFELKCKNCSVPLTYHKNDNKLKCHYCGWQTLLPQSCPKCGSLDIGISGFGTEFIENETREKFPNAKIIRVDTDSFKKKEELLNKLDDFKNGKYDIMLGTQMIAKGLNFPNLQLVGIILADTGLHMPDFRAGERTFSLITQVSGRAGRFLPDGKVIVQTYNPDIKAISSACNSEIDEFYKYEIENRKLVDFPPFSRLIRLVFRSYNQKLAIETAKDAYSILNENIKNDIEIIGPAECPISKISQNYRYQILLKSPSITALQNITRKLLYGYTHKNDIYIEYDIDPLNLL
ncbi:MAG: primosomal protein N' [Treponema sp.]|nr:primosomal protein N' [Treponema sp.]